MARVTTFADGIASGALWHADDRDHQVYECRVVEYKSIGPVLLRVSDNMESPTMLADTYTTQAEAEQALAAHLAAHAERDRVRREGTRHTTTAERQAAYDALREAQRPAESRSPIEEGEWDVEDLDDAIDAAESFGNYDEPRVTITQEWLKRVGHGHVYARDLQQAVAWAQVK